MRARPLAFALSTAFALGALLGARANAAPACPYDGLFAQIASSGGQHPALAGLASALARNQRSDLSPEAQAAGCRWTPQMRYVRTFSGLTNRCGLGVVGYTWQPTACRSYTPNPVAERFALVDFDARGRLRLAASGLTESDPRVHDPIVPPDSGIVSTCTPVSSGNAQGASAAMTALRLADVRFDGCQFMGIDPEVVRGEVLDCMQRVNTGLVAVELRASGTPVGSPTCKVVTDIDRRGADQWVRIASGLGPDSTTFTWALVQGTSGRVFCASNGPLDPQGCARNQPLRRPPAAPGCALATADRRTFSALGTFLCAEPAAVLSRHPLLEASSNPPEDTSAHFVQVYATSGVVVRGVPGVPDAAVNDAVQRAIAEARQCVQQPGAASGTVAVTEILLEFMVGETGIGAVLTTAPSQDREIAACLTRALRSEQLRAPAGSVGALYNYAIRVRRR